MTGQSTFWKRIFWIAAGIGFVIGLYGLYDRLAFGHMHADYGSYVPWGLWVAAYTMLVGASAGAFVIAAVIHVFGRKEWYPVGRTALIVSLAAFTGGMLSIWLDLGHPERLLNFYFSPNLTSIMGLMSWFYLLYGILLVVMIWQSWVNQEGTLLRNLSFLAVPFAIAFAGAEGALFGVVGARPLWESGLTPILFLVEGAMTGTAAVALGAFLLEQLDEAKGLFLGRVLLALILSVLLLEWADYSTVLYSGIPAKAEAVNTILFGPFWWVFWLIHLALGMIIPLLLIAFRPNSRLFMALGAALNLGTAVSTKLNLIIPALTQAELEGLEHAFTGPGLTFNYFPTIPEWALFIWIGSLAVLLFLGGSVLVPRFLQKEAK